MEIIAHFFTDVILEQFLKEWRTETMTALIVYLITFFVMQRKINVLEKLLKEKIILIKEYKEKISTYENFIIETKIAIQGIKRTLEREVDKKDIIDTLERMYNSLE